MSDAPASTDNGAIATQAASSVSPKVKKSKAAASSGVKKPKTKPNHPPTSEMVNNAIQNLKERSGSSLQAIKKYISANYKIDADKLSPFIKKYLKSAVTGGQLVQTKGKGASGSFKLSKPPKAKTTGEKKKKPAASPAKKVVKLKKTAAKPKTNSEKKVPAAKKVATTSDKKKAQANSVKIVKKSGASVKSAPKQKPTKAKSSAPKKPKTPKPKKAVSPKKAAAAPKKAVTKKK